MRKLAALLFVASLLAPATLALAQTAQPTTPARAQTQNEAIPTAPQLFERAAAEINADQFDQALVDLSLFLLLNPTNPRGYFLRAVAYDGLTQSPKAFEDLNKAIPLAEPLPGLQAAIYTARAQLYVDTQQFPGALSDFDAAIRIDPTADRYAGRAQLHMFQSNYDSAIDDLNNAIQLAPDDKILNFYRAAANAGRGQDATAAPDYLAYIASIANEPRNAQPVELGASFQVDMAEGIVYVIPFRATEGQTITAIVSPVSGGIDPLVVLLDEANKPLTANDDARPGDLSAVIVGYHIPADGTYQIVISHALGGSEGRIAVRINGE